MRSLLAAILFHHLVVAVLTFIMELDTLRVPGINLDKGTNVRFGQNAVTEGAKPLTVPAQNSISPSLHGKSIQPMHGPFSGLFGHIPGGHIQVPA